MRTAVHQFVSSSVLQYSVSLETSERGKHTPVLYRLFACSTVLYLVRRWVIGCLVWMGARGSVGRSCLGWRAPLEKQRWHCRAGRPVRARCSTFEDAIECDILARANGQLAFRSCRRRSSW